MGRVYLAVYKKALTCCLDNTDIYFKLINFQISRGIPPCLFLSDHCNLKLLPPCWIGGGHTFFHVVEIGFFLGYNVLLAWPSPLEKQAGSLIWEI